MNILYVSVIEQHQGWGAETFLNRGFLVNGDRTITLDYRKERKSLSQKFLELTSSFDVFFLQRGDYFPLPLVAAIQGSRFFWATELVVRCPDQDQLLSSGQFDHIFVHSDSCRKTVIDNGWQRPEAVSVLLNGFDPEVHRPLSLGKDIDILFVGNTSARRDRWLKKMSVAPVTAYQNEMVRLMNRAKIVLNIHAENQLDTETRVFEALGCGAFLITEKLSSENPFLNGMHLIEVDSAEEMFEQCRYYLAHSDEREKIARQGYEESTSKHSYRHRAGELKALFSRYPAKPASINRGAILHYQRFEQIYAAVAGLIKQWHRVVRLLRRLGGKI